MSSIMNRRGAARPETRGGAQRAAEDSLKTRGLLSGLSPARRRSFAGMIGGDARLDAATDFATRLGAPGQVASLSRRLADHPRAATGALAEIADAYDAALGPRAEAVEPSTLIAKGAALPYAGRAARAARAAAFRAPAYKRDPRYRNHVKNRVAASYAPPAFDVDPASAPEKTASPLAHAERRLRGLAKARATHDRAEPLETSERTRAAQRERAQRARRARRDSLIEQRSEAKRAAAVELDAFSAEHEASLASRGNLVANGTPIVTEGGPARAEVLRATERADAAVKAAMDAQIDGSARVKRELAEELAPIEAALRSVVDAEIAELERENREAWVDRASKAYEYLATPEEERTAAAAAALRAAENREVAAATVGAAQLEAARLLRAELPSASEQHLETLVTIGTGALLAFTPGLLVLGARTMAGAIVRLALGGAIVNAEGETVEEVAASAALGAASEVLPDVAGPFLRLIAKDLMTKQLRPDLLDDLIPATAGVPSRPRPDASFPEVPSARGPNSVAIIASGEGRHVRRLDFEKEVGPDLYPAPAGSDVWTKSDADFDAEMERLFVELVEKPMRDGVDENAAYDAWFAQLTPAQLARLWERDQRPWQVFKHWMRKPGQQHEYLMVSAQPTLRRLGFTASDVRSPAYRMPTSDMRIKDPESAGGAVYDHSGRLIWGVKGLRSGGRVTHEFHLDLGRVWYKIAHENGDAAALMTEFAEKYLVNGVDDLPPGIRDIALGRKKFEIIVD